MPRGAGTGVIPVGQRRAVCLVAPTLGLRASRPLPADARPASRAPDHRQHQGEDRARPHGSPSYPGAAPRDRLSSDAAALLPSRHFTPSDRAGPVPAPRCRHLGRQRIDLRDPAPRGAAGHPRAGDAPRREPGGQAHLGGRDRLLGPRRARVGHTRLRRPRHRRRAGQWLLPHRRHGHRSLQHQDAVGTGQLPPTRSSPAPAMSPSRKGGRWSSWYGRRRSTSGTCARCSPWPRWAPSSCPRPGLLPPSQDDPGPRRPRWAACSTGSASRTGS